MKLHRFTALDNHRAILIVREKLGPDALVYSTRRIADGVEVLAGIPESEFRSDSSEEVPVEKSVLDRDTVDKLNLQMQMMEDSIQKLSTHIMTLYQAMNEAAKKKKRINWNIFRNLRIFRKQTTEVRYDKQAVY